MNNIPHKIIVSTNDDPEFFNLWEICYKSWKAFFPEVDVILNFVTSRTEDNEIVQHLKQWGTVNLYPEIDGIPTPNLAKVSRMIESSKHGNNICMVNDIDIIPLQREYVENRMLYFKPDQILGIGKFSESFMQFKFPMSYTTATGDVWKLVVNPHDLRYEDLVKSWIGLSKFDNQESITNRPSTEFNLGGFSDESLLRNLHSQVSGILNQIERGYDRYTEGVDRGAWHVLNREKLFNGEYIDSHLIRPLSKNIDKIQPLIDYIVYVANTQGYNEHSKK